MSSLWINDVFIVFMQQEKKLTFFKMLSTDLMENLRKECDEIVKDIDVYSKCLDENFELHKKLNVKQHVLICNKIILFTGNLSNLLDFVESSLTENMWRCSFIGEPCSFFVS